MKRIDSTTLHRFLIFHMKYYKVFILDSFTLSVLKIKYRYMFSLIKSKKGNSNKKINFLHCLKKSRNIIQCYVIY